MNNLSISKPIYAISPHRFCTDGFGVTTLVALYGCPLHCKWCINPRSQHTPKDARRLTPQELYDEVKHDDILFRATSGGVTFGGGEPCLYPDFIEEFSNLCSPDWNIRIETSLNVPTENVLSLLPVIDEWLVDIKLWDVKKYKDYTGKENDLVLQNLEHLLSIQEKVVVRVPIIEGFCDESEANQTKQFLCKLGFNDVQQYLYKDPKNIVVNRKWDCSAIRKVRLEIAKQNGIEIDDPECKNSFCYTGTCENCENQLKKLETKLNDLVEYEVKLDNFILGQTLFFNGNSGEFCYFKKSWGYVLNNSKENCDKFFNIDEIKFPLGGFS